MNADRRIKICFRGTSNDSNADTLNNLARIGPDHMRRNNLVTGSVNDQLHKGLFRTTRQVVLHRVEFAGIDRHIAMDGARPFLTRSNRTDGGLGKDI